MNFGASEQFNYSIYDNILCRNQHLITQIRAVQLSKHEISLIGTLKKTIDLTPFRAISDPLQTILEEKANPLQGVAIQLKIHP